MAYACSGQGELSRGVGVWLMHVLGRVSCLEGWGCGLCMSWTGELSRGVGVWLMHVLGRVSCLEGWGCGLCMSWAG